MKTYTKEEVMLIIAEAEKSLRDRFRSFSPQNLTDEILRRMVE